MPKLIDVANYANVSISTASKALNNSPEISKETANRVMKAARELNYIFDRDNGRTIGIIAPEAIGNDYSVLVHNIQNILFRSGYLTLIGFSNFSTVEEIKLMQMFVEKNVDGIIMVRLGSESSAVELEKLKKKSDIAIIQIVLPTEGNNIAAVYDGYIVDEEHGIYIALEYLKELGHEKIVFITESLSKSRAGFFLDSAKKLDLNVSDSDVFMGVERFELGGYLRMKEVLQRKELPTAVFASYDNMAIGAMRAIKEAGLEVPGNISVVGFDDIQAARYLPISLTTVGVPFEKLAKISAESLLGRLKTSNLSSIIHVTLKPDLYVRDSTSAIKTMRAK